MPVHFVRELDTLKRKVLSLASMVEENLQHAVHALEKGDAQLARRLISSDIEIDHMEVEIEEECLKILALHQPVANDLRFIVAVIKINSDLERIGDLAVNIAERAEYLADGRALSERFNFATMAEAAQTMLRQSLDSLVELDAALARKVCADDEKVDAFNRRIYEQVKEAMKENPEEVDTLTHILAASRHIERVGDHATNIAEDVIYMVEGRIARHRPENYRATNPASNGPCRE